MTFTGATGVSPPSILDRERIIAKPGFNRWLVPPAALAIHLCIGMAYGFSVFWLPLSRAVATATGTKVQTCAGDATTFWEKTIGTLHALTATNCEWTQFDLGWMFTLFFVLLGSSAALWGGWLEPCGATQGGSLRGALLVRRPHDIGARRQNPSAVDAMGRFRHHWRRWSWPRLYLAGFDADQMVSGPAWHGNGHGDHGFWRWRHDRLAARQSPHESFQDPDLSSLVLAILSIWSPAPFPTGCHRIIGARTAGRLPRYERP